MKILLAEDERVSRLLLQKAVASWDYETITVADGAEALDHLLGDDPPRLAVLDWMMPEIDGIQICKILRSIPQIQPIYIILLTGRTSKKDLVHALEQGADDYLAKPFDREELRSRLQVGQRQLEMQAQLERYATQMESLAEERSRQLIHAERMATVGLMAAGIAHEINNPTAFITGNVQVQRKFWEKTAAALEQYPEIVAGDSTLSMIVEEMPGTIDSIAKGADRITQIVKGLKGFCRQEDGQRHPCNINNCIEESLTLTHNALKYHVTIQRQLANDLPEILADGQQVEQILINLLVNAADAISERGDGQGHIAISTLHDDHRVRLVISDDGPGIPPAKLESIWEPFYTTKPADRGTGLGLSIVRGIIEDHGGSISVCNKDEGGAEFTIHFPLPKQTSAH